MQQVIIQEEDLNVILGYLSNKIEDMSKKEAKQKIEHFLAEDVKKISGMVI